MSIQRSDKLGAIYDWLGNSNAVDIELYTNLSLIQYRCTKDLTYKGRVAFQKISVGFAQR